MRINLRLPGSPFQRASWMVDKGLRQQSTWHRIPEVTDDPTKLPAALVTSPGFTASDGSTAQLHHAIDITTRTDKAAGPRNEYNIGHYYRVFLSAYNDIPWFYVEHTWSTDPIDPLTMSMGTPAWGDTGAMMALFNNPPLQLCFQESFWVPVQHALTGFWANLLQDHDSAWCMYPNPQWAKPTGEHWLFHRQKFTTPHYNVDGAEWRQVEWSPNITNITNFVVNGSQPPQAPRDQWTKWYKRNWTYMQEAGTGSVKSYTSSQCSSTSG